MDWFERITGQPERGYARTQASLRFSDGRLSNLHTGRSFGVGTFSLPTLAELRAQAQAARLPGRLRLSLVEGDVRALHQAPENAGALFQVASQFNMLEMIGPQVSPEDGVTRYAYDATQGPACAMAAGAATIYRNYLVPCDGGIGQTAQRQLDGLADLGTDLCAVLGMEQGDLWTMRNGYALATRSGLDRIARHLAACDEARHAALRGLLRVGLHSDVEVTDAPASCPHVSQVFCSALPVAYGAHPSAAWAPFARLVLEAAYEATLLAGLLNAARGASNRVLLTRLGGGAFGNSEAWIDEALLRGVRLFADQALDVAIVSYRKPSAGLRALLGRFHQSTEALR